MCPLCPQLGCAGHTEQAAPGAERAWLSEAGRPGMGLGSGGAGQGGMDSGRNKCLS